MISKEEQSLPFQNVYANAFAENGVYGDYTLISSEQNKLGKLPSKLKEAEVFSILDMLKACELDSYRAGRIEQQKQDKGVLQEVVKQYESKMQVLMDENTRLASKLELLIISEEV